MVGGNAKPTAKGFGRIFVIGWKMEYPSCCSIGTAVDRELNYPVCRHEDVRRLLRDREYLNAQRPRLGAARGNSVLVVDQDMAAGLVSSTTLPAALGHVSQSGKRYDLSSSPLKP